MNAVELYEAAFDSANDYAEPTAEYVQQYADGAFDLAVPADAAEKIAVIRRGWLALVESGEADSNQKYHTVTAPLEEIEL